MEKIYNKLVRDRIPQIIENDGKKAVCRQITDNAEMQTLLVNKLREEVEEYCTSLDHNELADILEVIRTLAENQHNLSLEDIDNIRFRKELERGGFQDGVFLEKVVE